MFRVSHLICLSLLALLLGAGTAASVPNKGQTNKASTGSPARVATEQKDFDTLIKNARSLMVANHSWQQALEYADLALKQRPNSLEALCVKGHALAAVDRHSEGEAILRKVINNTKPGEPLWEESVNTLAYSHLLSSKWSETLADLNLYLAHYPGTADCWYTHADCLDRLHKYPEALTSIRKAIAINPAYAKCYVMEAKLLHLLNKHQETIEACNHAITLDPQAWQAYDLRAKAHKALGNYHQQLLDVCKAQGK